MTGVERFWWSRVGTFHLDSTGFLADPHEQTFGCFSLNPDVISTAGLREHQALVLLGEMGSGKTTIMQRPELLLSTSIPLHAIDLALYGSEDRIVNEVLRHKKVVDWIAADGELGMVLDGFDEAQARVPQLGQILAQEIQTWPVDRLYFRIASRTVNWSLLLENSLRQTFGDVAVREILPLRRMDAAAIAADLCDDAAKLLQAVDQASAAVFASRPQTLKLLARVFQTTGSLPERAADLFDQGTRALAVEQSSGRIEAGLQGTLSVDERIAVARRIAVALAFGKASAILTGSSAEVGADDLTLDSLVGGAEPTPNATIEISRATIEELMSAGLFSSRGPNRFGFAHASFQDYLAACWIRFNGLSEAQVRPLLVGPDGRAWPQMRVTAGWLVAVAPEQFAWLAIEDPESFRGEVDLPGDGLRSAVVDGLFGKAALSNRGWNDQLDGLQHPGLADQLRDRLRFGSLQERQLALHLVRDCSVTEVLPDVIEIALKPTESHELRTAAGLTAIGGDDSGHLGALTPLVRDHNVRGEDPHHQLLGIGLLGSWPHIISTTEVFASLPTAAPNNFYGQYEIFLSQFASSLVQADLSVAIAWLEASVETVQIRRVENLANAVLRLAAAHLAVGEVTASLARIIVIRARMYGGLLFDGTDKYTPLEMSVANRRSLVEAVITASSGKEVLAPLCWSEPNGFGLIDESDLGWILDRMAMTSGDLCSGLGTLFQFAFRLENQEHVDLVLGLGDDHPVRKAYPFLYEIVLDTEHAIQQKRLHDLSKPMPVNAEPPDDFNNQTLKYIAKVETGEPEAFSQAARFLAMGIGAQWTNPNEADLTKRQRWDTFSVSDQSRIVNAAEIFLCSAMYDAENQPEESGGIHHPSIDGYRALVMLLKQDRPRLTQLPSEVWVEWAPTIATIRCVGDAGSETDKGELLQLAAPHASDQMVAATIVQAQAAVASADHFSSRIEVDILFDDALAGGLGALITRSPEPPLRDLLDALARNDVGTVRPMAQQIVRNEAATEERRLAAAAILIEYDLPGSWPQLKVFLDLGAGRALAAFGETQRISFGKGTSDLSEDLLADVYLWLRSLFPPAEDPKFEGVHPVDSRETIGHFRDSLLGELRDRGTIAGIEAIARIRAALPDENWLGRLEATAQTTYSQTAWSPTSIPELLRLAHEQRSVVVNSEADLLAAVVAALEDIQAELTGANPQSHLLWDTHAGRPKSEDEISDHLRNRLQELLGGKRIIVNREVQIRRNSPSGIPERTDILVEATVTVTGTGTGTASLVISVPIEVKGAWNSDLMTAMRSQLIDRYMSDLQARRGVYVVLWPDLTSWTAKDDHRRGKIEGLDRQSTRAQLDDQAGNLSSDQTVLKVIHLAIDYLRPNAVRPTNTPL